MTDVSHSFAQWEQKLAHHLQPMSQTPQEPLWHGEGDVLTHTRLVCEALTGQEDFCALSETEQLVLYLAALLHDLGKPKTTCVEDGRLVSPGHARVGSEIARQILWQQELCGSVQTQQIRESICDLIRYHTMPPHAFSDKNGSYKLRKAAANGALAAYFQIHHLCMLARADVEGRISNDREELLERIELCRELALESQCCFEPYPFASDYTAYAYFAGRNVPAQAELYDDTWGEVILMSGLPGTGKDTWIQTHYSHLPMISLDEIRKELGISPLDVQTPVVEAAKERAKELLRKKQPFVWNATNLTLQTRSRQTELFAGYGASVTIEYLETPWQEQLRRNREREKAVPEAAICRMLTHLVPPQRWEAHRVRWHCV